MYPSTGSQWPMLRGKRHSIERLFQIVATLLCHDVAYVCCSCSSCIHAPIGAGSIGEGNDALHVSRTCTSARGVAHSLVHREEPLEMANQGACAADLMSTAVLNNAGCCAGRSVHNHGVLSSQGANQDLPLLDEGTKPTGRRCMQQPLLPRQVQDRWLTLLVKLPLTLQTGSP